MSEHPGDEVDRIERESFAHAAEDMVAHRVIDLKNQARLDIRAIERQLDKVGDLLEGEYRKDVEAHVAAVKTFLDEDQPDPDAMHKCLDAMDKSTVRLAEIAIAATLREEQQATGKQ